MWEIIKMEHSISDGNVFKTVSNFTLKEDLENGELAIARDSFFNKFEADPKTPGYIPFEDLTKEIVLGWIWETIDKEQVEADVLIKFEADKYALENPEVSDSLPINWN